MADYQIDLTPALRNFATEGGLDNSLDSNGNTIQRTFHGLLVKNGNDRKMVGRLKDGDVFNDVVETIGDIPNIVGL